MYVPKLGDDAKYSDCCEVVEEVVLRVEKFHEGGGFAWNEFALGQRYCIEILVFCHYICIKLGLERSDAEHIISSTFSAIEFVLFRSWRFFIRWVINVR